MVYEALIPDFNQFQDVVDTPLPHTLRVNTHKTLHDALQDRLETQGFAAERNPYNQDFFTVDRSPSKTVEHWAGRFYMQEISASFAPRVLNPEQHEHILDVAAAPGGKTTYLSQLMENTGLIVANDAKSKRLRALQSNVYRLGCVNVAVTNHDGRHIPGATFDRVLLDAPCTGEGNVRQGTASLRASKQDRESLSRLQKALLLRSIDAVKERGVVVYSTCTFAPEENEAVINYALEKRNVSVEKTGLNIPSAPGVTRWQNQSFDQTVENCVRIYPHHVDSGGAFIAKLRKHG